MTALAFDRVQENSASQGVGDLMLSGAPSPALRTVGSVFADAALVSYVALNLVDATQWERGIGTYNATTNAIARTHVLAGSDGTAAVDFSAGDKLVLNAPPARADAVRDR